MTIPRLGSRRPALDRWLAAPQGQLLLSEEQRWVEQAFDGIFGEHCLQLGAWGDGNAFLRHARTRRSVYLAEPAMSGPGGHPEVWGHAYRLPLQSESMDAVFLPHTLEFSGRPHAILREVHRVLRADGHLVILGFKPGGLWGLRRLLPGAGTPPCIDKLIADRQLCDWLKLLDVHIGGISRYFFHWPYPRNHGSTSRSWEERGRRWWPELAACYMLTAQKRVYAMTPLRKPWLARPKVVGGLVKPTTRVRPIRPDPALREGE